MTITNALAAVGAAWLTWQAYRIVAVTLCDWLEWRRVGAGRGCRYERRYTSEQAAMLTVLLIVGGVLLVAVGIWAVNSIWSAGA